MGKSKSDSIGSSYDVVLSGGVGGGAASKRDLFVISATAKQDIMPEIQFPMPPIGLQARNFLSSMEEARARRLSVVCCEMKEEINASGHGKDSWHHPWNRQSDGDLGANLGQGGGRCPSTQEGSGLEESCVIVASPTGLGLEGLILMTKASSFWEL